MSVEEKARLLLTKEEADFIEEIITRNEFIIRAVVKSALCEKFELIGEDCISEIYLLACEKIDILKNHEKPDAWITVAAKNVAMNMARKHNTVLNNTSDEEIRDFPTDDTTFEDALYNIWMKEGTIEKLLNLLTPHEREIYELIYKKRKSSKEAAKILNISDSTVRNISSTIKKKIKNSIENNIF